jgi:hypothetical protein
MVVLVSGEGAFGDAAARDGVVVHEPERCGCCGGSLVGAELVGVESREVWDIPAGSLPREVFVFVERLLAEEKEKRR